MTASVHVRAPCRLHFGMFSFGHADHPEFGGVGMMIEPPCVQINISPSADFIARGLLSERVSQFVKELVEAWKLESLPKCSIEVQSPQDHAGLGVGTQLGLSVAAGLRRFLRLPQLSTEALAASIGRGGRSAVGTYGFAHGGLIVDAGKLRSESLGKLYQREEVPSDWRIVLIGTGNGRGLAGMQEAEAFAALPPIPEGLTRGLWRLVSEDMIPALRNADCTGFGESVYEFGRLAGECFAAVQGGAFASMTIEQTVKAVRDFGVPGIGQSSWGPTVFAIVPTSGDAERLTNWLQNRPGARDCENMVASPNITGAAMSD